MPIKEATFKSALTGEISSFLEKKRQDRNGVDGDVEFLSVIDFIERFKLLPYGLYPVQKFIVKMYYNIPLDTVNKTIQIRNMFGDKILHEFTEQEYLHYLYDSGRCNIREQGKTERRELILVIGRRSGKCSSLDTRITTSKGLITLGDIIRDLKVNTSETGWTDFHTNITQERGKITNTDGIYYGGVQDVIRFKTYCGYSQTSTPEHRVKVLDENGKIIWKNFSDIKIGDYIGVNRSSSVWSEEYFDLSEINRTLNKDGLPKRVDERLGELLGILSGDGTWTRPRFLQVSGGCEEFLPHVINIISQYTGSVSLYRKIHPRNTCEISAWKVTGYSTSMRNLLDSIGWRKNATKSDKSIPWVIWRSPKSVAAAYLRGLFETDGGMEKGNIITFSSHSEQLCKDVQILLLNFGIVSRYTSKYNKRFNSTNYILNILGGKSRKIFADNIGFITKRKNDVLLSSLLIATDGCSDTESIPNLKTFLRSTRDSIPISRNNKSGIRNRPRSDLKELASGALRLNSNENISYERLQRFVAYSLESGADAQMCNELQNVIDCNYFWDQVTSIDLDRVPVADLSVPDGHEYVANGFTNHNSAMSAIFAAYELYKLLRRGNPQAYYGMPSGSEIRVLCVANDKEQASIVFDDMRGHIEQVDYFKSSLANMTQTFMKFRTEGDKNKFGDHGKATVAASFKSSIAKGLRGRGVICCILDEIAFFVDNGSSSADRVYKAIMPALGQFSPRDKNNKLVPIGPTEGRMILISSPDAKDGFFYRSYQMAMSNSKGASDMLVIQAPTWEVNPTLDRSYYEKEYHKDPKSFMTEHGAEFSDRVRGWIEDANDLQECIVPELRPKDRGFPRDPHFAGIDVGLVNDGTAISLTRIHNGKIELVYHEVWYAKRKWKESNPHLTEPPTPYARTLQDQNRLDISEIANWFRALSQRFYIVKGIFDQWSGIVFEQELHKVGLRQFETRNFFTSDSSQLYQTFKMFLYNKQLALYDWPRPDPQDGMSSSRHSPMVTELLELQATSGGKNITIVEAPGIAGKHDDVSDSLARSILLASEYIKENPGALERMGGVFENAQSGPGNPMGYHQYHRMRNRIHGASSSVRAAPRNPRR